MTKGQRAMAVAKIYPDPEKGGRGKTVRLPDGLSKQRISEARTVLQYAPDLADNVLAGSDSLDDAYKTARERKEKSTNGHQNITKQRIADARAVLAYSPDLAESRDAR